VVVAARNSATEDPIDELKLYVGSPSRDINAAGLKPAFEPYGNFEATDLIERFTIRLRGFGSAVVKFEAPDAANNAIAAMNGQEFGGRAIVCINARKMVVFSESTD
jgi:RNA recognition motif-containing protein